MTDEQHKRNGNRTEIALRQFKAVRQRTRTNMLNRTKVGRIARQSGLRELADIADDRGRYYALLERYYAEGRSNDEDTDE